jgi:hypothetical protein
MTADTKVLAMRPDVTPGIASLEVTARRPDGGTDVLLFAKDFSAKWPTPFVFAEPIVLRRGTRLSATAYAANGPAPAALAIAVSTAPAR